MDESPSTNAIKSLLSTGMRMSEALKLKWENVNMESGNVLLVQTKSGKSKTVSLNRLALDILARMKEFQENEFVFPGSGPKKRLLSPKRAFIKVKESTGIDNFRIDESQALFREYSC